MEIQADVNRQRYIDRLTPDVRQLQLLWNRRRPLDWWGSHLTSVCRVTKPLETPSILPFPVIYQMKHRISRCINECSKIQGVPYILSVGWCAVTQKR
eukprot:sb/3479028/